MPDPAPVRAMDEAAIADAVAVIARGGLVAFPTETVYGLGGDATNADAVAAIFAAKGRPTFNPLISHVGSLDAATSLAELGSAGRQLAEAFWPGPLTLVAMKQPTCTVAQLATAGLETIAVRIPGNAAARSFLTACDRPIAAPSANRSGAISPTRAAHVAASLPGPKDGGPELILDGGPCDVGLESTVVDVSCDEPTILRLGGLAHEDIEGVIGPLSIAGSDDAAPRSPGMLSRHYAPRASLRLNAGEPSMNEAFLGFGACSIADYPNLSPTGDLKEAAANLFDMLHQLDAQGPPGIAVAPIPDHGLGAAINDRLRRACIRE